MPFTDDNNLEIPTSGVADWDTPVSADFTTLAGGWQFKGIAGLAVNTGDAVCLLGAFVYPYDASSMDAPRPIAVSRLALGSGDAGQFQKMGTVRSIDIWAGEFVIGEQVFVDPAVPGKLTSSYSAAKYPVGWALEDQGIVVIPSVFEPEKITYVESFALTVGVPANFEVHIGHRGIVHELSVINTSLSNFKLRFWTGSARVGSEEIYETVTTSIDGGALDFDVATMNFRDRSTWTYWNTDITSPGLIFGTIDVQSSNPVGSGDASLTFIVERTA